MSSSAQPGLARLYQLYRQVLRVHRSQLPPPLRCAGGVPRCYQIIVEIQSSVKHRESRKIGQGTPAFDQATKRTHEIRLAAPLTSSPHSARSLQAATPPAAFWETANQIPSPVATSRKGPASCIGRDLTTHSLDFLTHPAAGLLHTPHQVPWRQLCEIRTAPPSQRQDQQAAVARVRGAVASLSFHAAGLGWVMLGLVISHSDTGHICLVSTSLLYSILYHSVTAVNHSALHFCMNNSIHVLTPIPHAAGACRPPMLWAPPFLASLANQPSFHCMLTWLEPPFHASHVAGSSLCCRGVRTLTRRAAPSPRCIKQRGS